MNGAKPLYLLDSCFLIRWYGKYHDAISLIQQHNLQFEQCAYSVISYTEVLGWHGVTPQDDVNLRALFARLGAKLDLSDEIVEYTIQLRKTHKIKLPDVFILATAKIHGLTLLTLDDKLAKINLII